MTDSTLHPFGMPEETSVPTTPQPLKSTTSDTQNAIDSRIKAQEVITPLKSPDKPDTLRLRRPRKLPPLSQSSPPQIDSASVYVPKEVTSISEALKETRKPKPLSASTSQEAPPKAQTSQEAPTITVSQTVTASTDTPSLQAIQPKTDQVQKVEQTTLQATKVNSLFQKEKVIPQENRSEPGTFTKLVVSKLILSRIGQSSDVKKINQRPSDFPQNHDIDYIEKEHLNNYTHASLSLPLEKAKVNNSAITVSENEKIAHLHVFNFQQKSSTSQPPNCRICVLQPGSTLPQSEIEAAKKNNAAIIFIESTKLSEIWKKATNTKELQDALQETLKEKIEGIKNHTFSFSESLTFTSPNLFLDISDENKNTFQQKHSHPFALSEFTQSVHHGRAHLQGIELRHSPLQKPEDQKWVVYMNPKDMKFEEGFGLLDDVFSTGANVCSFNYRGVGKSTGFPRTVDDLVEDGTAVIKRLLKKGVRPENIVVHGFSLGGAVATKAVLDINEQLKKDGKGQLALCNERSFKSFQGTTESCVADFISEGIGDGVISKTAAKFARNWIQSHNWNIEFSDEELQKLDPKRVCAIYHENDRIVNKTNSFATNLLKAINTQSQENVTLIKQDKTTETTQNQSATQESFSSAHCAFITRSPGAQNSYYNFIKKTLKLN
jgi:hypothetical protein